MLPALFGTLFICFPFLTCPNSYSRARRGTKASVSLAPAAPLCVALLFLVSKVATDLFLETAKGAGTTEGVIGECLRVSRQRGFAQTPVLTSTAAAVLQVVLEKLRAGSTAVAALACVHSSDAAQLAECEKTFTTAVLTRLLLRPAAAPLYSQLAQQLGRGFGDYLIQQVESRVDTAPA